MNRHFFTLFIIFIYSEASFFLIGMTFVVDNWVDLVKKKKMLDFEQKVSVVWSWLGAKNNKPSVFAFVWMRLYKSFSSQAVSELTMLFPHQHQLSIQWPCRRMFFQLKKYWITSRLIIFQIKSLLKNETGRQIFLKKGARIALTSFVKKKNSVVDE